LITFLPLTVGAPIALRSAQNDKNIGGNPDFWLTLHGISEQIPRHKNIGVISKKTLQIFF
jgi:hypothetical protein